MIQLQKPHARQFRPDRHVLAVLCLVLTVGVATKKANAQSPLARLVPDDVGLVIEAAHFTRDSAALAAGPLGQRLRGYPPVAAWRAQHEAQIAGYAAQLQHHLGVRPSELWELLLGRHVLLAIWPETPESTPGNAPMVLLLETADPARLQEVLSRGRAAAAQSGGRVKLQQQQVGAVSVTVYSFGGDPHGQLHVATLGSLAFASNSFSMLQRVLSLQAASRDGQGSLATLPAYLAASERLPAATLRLFISPRAWDSLIAHTGPDADEHEHRDRETALRGWQAVRYVAASLQLDQRLRVCVAVAWQADALPSALSGALAALRGPAGLARHVPANAIAVLAGRLDARQLVRALLPYAAVLGKRHTHAERADVGTALLLTLASYLGPEAVAYIVPLPQRSPTTPAEALPAAFDRRAETTEPPSQPQEASAAEDRLPASGGGLTALAWVAGLQTQAIDEPHGQPLAALAAPLLRTALEMQAAMMGDGIMGEDAVTVDRGRARVSTDDYKGQRLTTVSVAGDGNGPRLTVSFTAQQDVLWAASQRWALEQALDLPAPASLVQAAWWSELLPPQVANPGQLFYVNMAALHDILQGSPQAVNHLLGVPPPDGEMARRSHQELLALTALFDRLLVAGTVTEEGLALSLTVTADGPPNSN
ncbi:MAG: hypothetical protein K6T86_18765 [Pirellulales bacterium]|nr:hypothetical protein [Pirellulales bacterium]